MSILSDRGYLQKVVCADAGATAFITIKSEEKAASLASIIQAVAPLTGVLIEMEADASITKALNKDFLISSFGDRPVNIVITGMQITNTNTCKTTIKDSVMDFYKKNKISTDPSKRVTVSICAGSSAAQVFSCALVSMIVQAESESAEYGYCRYKINMIGVEEQKTKS